MGRGDDWWLGWDLGCVLRELFLRCMFMLCLHLERGVW